MRPLKREGKTDNNKTSAACLSGGTDGFAPFRAWNGGGMLYPVVEQKPGALMAMTGTRL